jgi:plastocyanin
MMRTVIHFGRQFLVGIVVVGVLSGCGAYGPAPAPPPPAPAPPAPGEAVTLNLAAKEIKYGTSTITVPAGSRVIVKFSNEDNVSHNFALYKTNSAAEAIYVGEIIGRGTTNYEFNAPTTPGTYFFRCDVHPTFMTGEFIVTATGS